MDSSTCWSQESIFTPLRLKQKERDVFFPPQAIWVLNQDNTYGATITTPPHLTPILVHSQISFQCNTTYIL